MLALLLKNQFFSLIIFYTIFYEIICIGFQETQVILTNVSLHYDFNKIIYKKVNSMV